MTDPSPRRLPPSRTLLYDGARHGTIARQPHGQGIAAGVVPSAAMVRGARMWARGGGDAVVARGGGGGSRGGGGRKCGVARRREGRRTTWAAGGLTGTTTPRAVRDSQGRVEGDGRGGVGACCAGVGGPHAVGRSVGAVVATERGREWREGAGKSVTVAPAPRRWVGARATLTQRMNRKDTRRGEGGIAWRRGGGGCSRGGGGGAGCSGRCSCCGTCGRTGGSAPRRGRDTLKVSPCL